jgi:hypothetical protein
MSDLKSGKCCEADIVQVVGRLTPSARETSMALSLKRASASRQSHGYAATREAAMDAFAKSWRRK